MQTQRPTPLRGLLAGLLALIAFASTAVAMTAGRTSSTAGSPAQLAAAQTVVGGDGGPTDAARGGDEADGHDGGRRHH
jgi:hypothetical protein